VAFSELVRHASRIIIGDFPDERASNECLMRLAQVAEVKSNALNDRLSLVGSER